LKIKTISETSTRLNGLFQLIKNNHPDVSFSGDSLAGIKIHHLWRSIWHSCVPVSPVSATLWG